MNDTGDVFTPEMKVKRFLDSLAYILMLGNTNGIETNYKRVMHTKREVPVSSCPSAIDNLFYGSGSIGASYEAEEISAFKDMLDRLDAKASAYEAKKVSRKKEPSKFHKKLKMGIAGGTWYRVDTEGKFWVGNDHYLIDDQAVQYQAIQTEYGDYYAMDKILFADGKFYDMNYDEVTVYHIGGIF